MDGRVTVISSSSSVINSNRPGERTGLQRRQWTGSYWVTANLVGGHGGPPRARADGSKSRRYAGPIGGQTRAEKAQEDYRSPIVAEGLRC